MYWDNEYGMTEAFPFFTSFEYHIFAESPSNKRTIQASTRYEVEWMNLVRA